LSDKVFDDPQRQKVKLDVATIYVIIDVMQGQRNCCWVVLSITIATTDINVANHLSNHCSFNRVKYQTR